MSRSIAIVEDEVAIRENYVAAFQREGYSVDAYEARLSSLEQYATVLDRGMVEDLALVEALGAQRAATEAVIAVDEQLAEIQPLPEARERTPEIRH